MMPATAMLVGNRDVTLQHDRRVTDDDDLAPVRRTPPQTPSAPAPALGPARATPVKQHQEKDDDVIIIGPVTHYKPSSHLGSSTESTSARTASTTPAGTKQTTLFFGTKNASSSSKSITTTENDRGRLNGTATQKPAYKQSILSFSRTPVPAPASPVPAPPAARSASRQPTAYANHVSAALVSIGSDYDEYLQPIVHPRHIEPRCPLPTSVIDLTSEGGYNCTFHTIVATARQQAAQKAAQQTKGSSKRILDDLDPALMSTPLPALKLVPQHQCNSAAKEAKWGEKLAMDDVYDLVVVLEFLNQFGPALFRLPNDTQYQLGDVERKLYQPLPCFKVLTPVYLALATFLENSRKDAAVETTAQYLVGMLLTRNRTELKIAHMFSHAEWEDIPPLGHVKALYSLMMLIMTEDQFRDYVQTANKALTELRKDAYHRQQDRKDLTKDIEKLELDVQVRQEEISVQSQSLADLNPTPPPVPDGKVSTVIDFVLNSGENGNASGVNTTKRLEARRMLKELRRERNQKIAEAAAKRRHIENLNEADVAYGPKHEELRRKVRDGHLGNDREGRYYWWCEVQNPSAQQQLVEALQPAVNGGSGSASDASHSAIFGILVEQVEYGWVRARVEVPLDVDDMEIDRQAHMAGVTSGTQIPSNSTTTSKSITPTSANEGSASHDTIVLPVSSSAASAQRHGDETGIKSDLYCEAISRFQYIDRLQVVEMLVRSLNERGLRERDLKQAIVSKFRELGYYMPGINSKRDSSTMFDAVSGVDGKINNSLALFGDWVRDRCQPIHKPTETSRNEYRNFMHSKVKEMMTRGAELAGFSGEAIQEMHRCTQMSELKSLLKRMLTGRNDRRVYPGRVDSIRTWSEFCLVASDFVRQLEARLRKQQRYMVIQIDSSADTDRESEYDSNSGDRKARSRGESTEAVEPTQSDLRAMRAARRGAPAAVELSNDTDEKTRKGRLGRRSRRANDAGGGNGSLESDEDDVDEGDNDILGNSVAKGGNIAPDSSVRKRKLCLDLTTSELEGLEPTIKHIKRDNVATNAAVSDTESHYDGGASATDETSEEDLAPTKGRLPAKQLKAVTKAPATRASRASSRRCSRRRIVPISDDEEDEDATQSSRTARATKAVRRQRIPVKSDKPNYAISSSSAPEDSDDGDEMM
ncbi:hypothetical protein SeMB42_g07310 [Synchytrium endobioticum]|uniref:WHIM2 domain-containing protein n=1 Tax=Synchytrium endobioticum TaxID=286115 RepID=A0A507D4Y6_9FUNG|nr:hypothetical protein SeMB42_g07310 [Synchytrium endobioticum]TPX46579.1 hypothetical protein SeLEV6574_g03147 [Synchytrium endobioticum]